MVEFVYASVIQRETKVGFLESLQIYESGTLDKNI